MKACRRSSDTWPGRGPSWRRAGRLAAALAGLIGVAALFAGCIKIDMAIRLNDDGSGTLAIVQAFDTSLFDELSKSFGGSSSDFDPNTLSKSIDQSSLPAGSKVEPYKRDKYAGVQVSIPFKSGDDVGALLNRVSSELSASQPGGGAGGSPPGGTGRTGATPTARGAATPAGATGEPLFQSFALRREGSGWKFDAVVAPFSTQTGAAGDFLDPNALKSLFKDASFNIRLKLPGTVVSTNADDKSDGELTWKLDFFADKPRTLSATSDMNGGGSGFPIIPVAVVLAILVVLAGGGWLIASRRRARGAST